MNPLTRRFPLVLTVALVAVLALVPSPCPRSRPRGTLPRRPSAPASSISRNVPSGTGLMWMTVESWSTDQEREALLRGLQAGGTDGLLRAMRKMDKGYVRFQESLRWKVNHAVSLDTPEGARSGSSPSGRSCSSRPPRACAPRTTRWAWSSSRCRPTASRARAC